MTHNYGGDEIGGGHSENTPEGSADNAPIPRDAIAPERIEKHLEAGHPNYYSHEQKEFLRQAGTAVNWIRWGNAIIALCTVVTAIATCMQWEEMRTQNEVMNRQLNQMTADSMQAQKALDASIEMSRTDQRAWVGPVNKHVSMDANRPTKWSVVYKNYGKTPAINATAVAWGATAKKNVVVDEKAFEQLYVHALKTTLSVTTIYPSENVTLDHFNQSVLTETEYNAIMSGETQYFLMGKVYYSDIFETTHSTTFCEKFDIKKMSMTVYGKNNHAN